MARPLCVRLYAGPSSATLARRILRDEPPHRRRTYGLRVGARAESAFHDKRACRGEQAEPHHLAPAQFGMDDFLTIALRYPGELILPIRHGAFPSSAGGGAAGTPQNGEKSDFCLGQ